MENETKSDFSIDIGKWSIVISAGLICYGALRAHIYYSEFNISIFEFLLASEIITFFLKDIFFYAVMLPLIGVNILLFYILTTKDIPPKNYIPKTKEENSSPSRKSDLDKWFFLLFWIGPSLLLVLGERYEFRFLSYLLLWIIFLLISFFAFHDKPKVFRSILTVITFISIVSIVSQLEAKEVKKSHNVFFKYKIVFKNGTMISTENNNVYVGKTEEYIFFYNLESKSSTVFSRDEVKMIEKVETGMRPRFIF